ncbi:hypothetical protein OFN27_27495, partial [Escherichia coli]|nr:hypothetical protein [Escherichia coli]
TGVQPAALPLDTPTAVTTPAPEEGLIALIAGPDVLRFAPALNIPLADIAEAFVRLDRAVARLTR